MTRISLQGHRPTTFPQTTEQTFHELALQDTAEWTPDMLRSVFQEQGATREAGISSSSQPSHPSVLHHTYTQEESESKVYVRTPVPGEAARSSCYRAVQTVKVGAHQKTQTSGVLSRVMEDKIIRIVGALESKNHYGAINRNPAGGGIAYGSLQVLSRTGGLGQLLQDYAKTGGRYARTLLSFGNTQNESVVQRRDFQTWLVKAGQDPIMQRVQHAYFRKHYLEPALQFGKSLGLKDPASYLTLFDTFVHYGANKRWIHRKIGFFVKKFGEPKGMQQWTSWMRRSLQASYGKRFGQNSVVTKYNVWRANQLQTWLRNNPELKGIITMQAPNWRERVHIP